MYYRNINNDLFFIVRRLKEIDCGYFVRFVPSLRRYEIHNRFNNGNTYCFSSDKLDARVITKARRTSSGRVNELVDEIETENKKTLRKHADLTAKQIALKAETAFSKGG